MPGLAITGTLLLVLYPLLVFAGLHYFDPRTLGVIVIVALVLRYHGGATRAVSSLSTRHWAALGLPVLLGLSVVATNSELLLLLYPAAMNAAMLLLFGMTLLRPPTIIEHFARLRDPDLSPARVRYTRNVTVAWCLFFIGNGALATYSALFASHESWLIYNGFVAYVLMGLLFAGERMVRRRLQPRA